MSEGSQKNVVPSAPAAALVAAAHELKSPLILMNHLVQSLKDENELLSGEERARYLDRLQFTSTRMLRLIQQFTLSARLDGDHQLAFAFETEPLSMYGACEQVLHELGPYARANNQILQLRQQQCPHLVLANRDILHDIVTNLVDNAIRHNPQGSVVTLHGQCRGEEVRLHVHDDGQGVEPSALAKLRATLGSQPQPLSGRSASSGLGLYIVGQLAHAMGGSLGLGRSLVGTTFFVDFIRSRQLSLL